MEASSTQGPQTPSPTGPSNSWLPSSGTIQLGVALNYTFLGFTGTLQAGFTADVHGNCGAYRAWGGGVGDGAGFSGGVQASASNGNSICAMGGPFTNVSGTFGVDGAAGTVDYFQGAGGAPGGTVCGTGGTLGVGGGGSFSSTETTTKVTPFGGKSCNDDGKIQ